MTTPSPRTTSPDRDDRRRPAAPAANNTQRKAPASPTRAMQRRLIAHLVG